MLFSGPQGLRALACKAVSYFPVKGVERMKRRLVKVIFKVALAVFLTYILTIRVV